MSDEYPFKTTPHQHQLDCWRISKDRPAFANFMEMGCIDGEAEIVVSWGSSIRKMPLSELHMRGLSGSVPAKTRSLISGKFKHNQILATKYSGEKNTAKLILASGKSLMLTPDHEVYTTTGLIALHGLSIGDEVLTDNEQSSPTPDKVVNIKSSGKRKTYDLVMNDPGRNFIANGIVVHNCGKSKVEIDRAGYLFLEGKIKGNVVVAPKGMYKNWLDELPKHMSDAVKFQSACWSSSMTKDDKAALKNLYAEGDFLRTLVINIEALNREKATDEVVAFLKKYPSKMTVDESTTIKNPAAKRTKIMINVGKFARYRSICSGNPIPNGPMDLYSQSEFLQKNLMGFANYYAFRNRFAVLQQTQLHGQKPFQTIVGYRDLDKLKQIMRQFSFIIKKDDCLDLPKKVYQVIDVEMGKQQAEAYKKMTEDAFIKLADLSTVTAQMVITQLLKLHQIACGFIKPDFQDERPFDEPNDRLETLIDLLEQAPGKVIVWANYRYNIRQIVHAISDKFGKESVVDYYGDTDDKKRAYAKTAFQDPLSPVRFIVSNPDTGKFGNTWTQATTVIYYSNSYNLESREQSEDRAHRIGQEGFIHVEGEDPSVLYIDLRVRGTVDDRIIKILKNKKKLTDEIVASNWRWLIGAEAA